MSRSRRQSRYDIIGPWSEVKLEILQEYAAAYSQILSTRKDPSFHHAYIDAFAGAGLHIARSTGQFVPGSPLNALAVQPPFKEYFFIDLDGKKVKSLSRIVGPRPEVHIYEGDCNQLLIEKVLPQVKYEDYRRALCVLDPYGLHLTWKVTEAVGHSRSLDVFLNFPLVDMNRNVLWHNPELVDPTQAARMTAFWGDESWRKVAYTTEGNLFGWEVREPEEVIAKAFQDRLRRMAGFSYVPDPMPIRNTRGSILYYLFFASQQPIAESIVADIFRRHGQRGGSKNGGIFEN